MSDTAENPIEPPKNAQPAAPKTPRPRRSPLRLIIILFVLAVVATGGVLWWIRSDRYETTDDAQVQAHLSAISSRVAGTVTAVYVEENQFVNAGQLIAELDPRDYQNALDQAQSEKLQ